MTFHIRLALALGVAVVSACHGEKGPVPVSPSKQATLVVGAEVPNLVRVDHRGQVLTLRNGEPTLVYFYPKDGTPGCTREACAFRDAWAQYQAAGLRVIGVSSDTDAAHRAFAAEHELPFSLVADPEHVWSSAFGVGTFAGLDARMSFLVGRDGKIAHVYTDVDPGVHAKEVIAEAARLGVK